MNPKDPLSEHMLHLDPSAVIPFTHDVLGTHDAKLDDLRGAVADSSAEYVRRGPSWHEGADNSDWFNKQFFEEMEQEDEDTPLVREMPLPPIPPSTLTDQLNEVPPPPTPWPTHEMGSTALKSDQAELDAEQDAIYDWINDYIVFDYDKETERYGWKIAEEGRAFLEAHRQGIMEAVPIQLRHKAAHDDMLEILQMVAPGATYSNEFAFKIIKKNPYFLADNRAMFPDFVFDMDYVHAMIREGKAAALMLRWQCIEQDCLQEAVDLASKYDRTAVFIVLGELVGKVHISHEFLADVAATNPRGLVELMRQGYFPELKKNPEIIQRFFEVYNPWELVDAGILDELDIADLNQLLTHGVYKARMFSRLRTIGRIATLEQAMKVIDVFDVYSIVGEVSVMAMEIQSYVFQSIATQPGMDWTRYLGYFNHLSDDDYTFILDSMAHIDEKIQGINLIQDLFAGANEQLKSRFDAQYVQIKVRREREKQEQAEMNRRREGQMLAERSYFEAGNVSVETHDYHEPLDADAIIEALEYNGCVRAAGDIREIVNDTSRDNLMTCIAGTRDELTTYDLGADAGSKGSRRTVTEHEALQDFMDFIQRLPPTTYGDKNSLETELTYIGEREYSEAVEGIALYWKWFLQKDSDSQLYIGAVVSSETTTKSDIYMVDRILAHFSDEELAKYNGRILMGKDQVTQTDPEKVKAVLIDDWTISGAQLRGAYGTFVQDYPHLAKSVEIQLIAASEERVALGIEKVSGAYGRDGEYDRNLPTKVRAYYVAHTADTFASDARGARITGSHSSVDYGFTTDIARLKDETVAMPLIASVVRPYRQKDYTRANIERLQHIKEGIAYAA